MSTRPPAAVVPWFSKSQYPEILAVMTDSVLLPPTHEAWRSGFEERLRSLRQQNVEASIVQIDPRAFRLWCDAEDLPCNAESRLEFAELVAEMERSGTAALPLRVASQSRQDESPPVGALQRHIPGWPALDELPASARVIPLALAPTERG